MSLLGSEKWEQVDDFISHVGFRSLFNVTLLGFWFFSLLVVCRSRPYIDSTIMSAFIFSR